MVGPAEGVRRTVAYLRRLRAAGPPPPTAPPSRPGRAGLTVAAGARWLCACVALGLALAWWLAGGPLHAAPSEGAG